MTAKTQETRLLLSPIQQATGALIQAASKIQNDTMTSEERTSLASKLRDVAQLIAKTSADTNIRKLLDFVGKARTDKPERTEVTVSYEAEDIRVSLTHQEVIYLAHGLMEAFHYEAEHG